MKINYNEPIYTLSGSLDGISANIDGVEVILSSPQYSTIWIKGRQHTDKCEKHTNVSLMSKCTCGLNAEARDLIPYTGNERLDFFRAAWKIALEMDEPIKAKKEAARRALEEKRDQEEFEESQRIKKLHGTEPCKHCGSYCYGDCQAN